MNLFNVGAFFVLFREALEASIIMGVLLRYLDKTISKEKNPELLKKLKRQVWLGTIVGLGISVILGVIFTVVFYVLKQDILGSNMPLFEGSLQSLAVLLLTWLAFKMVSVNDMYAKWERKIQQATAAQQSSSATKINTDSNSDTTANSMKIIDSKTGKNENLKSNQKPSSLYSNNETNTETNSNTSASSPTDTSSDVQLSPVSTTKDIELGSKVTLSDTIDNKEIDQNSQKQQKGSYGFMLLTFSVIIREGLESVIFIAGVGGGDPVSLVIPGLLGIASGIAIGFALYKGSGSLDLKLFFRISTAVLLVIASGLACNAAWELEEWYYFKVVNWNVEGAGEEEEDDEFSKEMGAWEWVPERSPTLWDVCECCSENRNGFFQIMSTLVGWKCRPSVVTTVVYFGYWTIVLLIFVVKKLFRNKIKSN